MTAWRFALLAIVWLSVAACTNGAPQLTMLAADIDAPLIDGSSSKTISFSRLDAPVLVQAACDARVTEWMVSVGGTDFAPLESVFVDGFKASCSGKKLQLKIQPRKLSYSSSLVNEGDNETKSLVIKGRAPFGETAALSLNLRYVVDAVPVKVTVTSPSDRASVLPSTAAAFSVQGTCTDEGRPVTVKVGELTAGATCTSGNFNIGIGLSSLSAGAFELFVAHTDREGVVDEASLSLAKHDPVVVAFSSLAESVSEAGSSKEVTVSLSQAFPVPVTVEFAVHNSSTAGVADYSITTASPLTFEAGATSKTIQVSLTDDLLVEGDETVVIDLQNPSSPDAVLGAVNTRKTLTITDDDTGPVLLGFSPSSRSVTSIPASVTVSFDREMSAVEAQKTSNWSTSCLGTGAIDVNSVVLSEDKKTATVTINVFSEPAIGEACSLVAHESIIDSYLNRLIADESTRKVTYTKANQPKVISVTSSSAANTAYFNAGQTISIEVNFDESVSVSGASPTITLETGATDAVVSLTQGSGTATLSGTYTVAAGENSLDLNYASAGALMLTGGTIRNGAGIDASLALPATTDANALAQKEALVVDTVKPVAPLGVTIAAAYRFLDKSPVATFSAGSDPDGSGILRYSATIVRDSDSNTLGEVTSFSSGSQVGGLSLVNNTSYRFEVRAVDRAGNVSDPVSSVWKADDTAPTRPGTIAVGAAPTTNPFKTLPTLSFAPSTDAETSVNGYKIKISKNSGSLVKDWTSATTNESAGTIILNYSEGSDFLEPNTTYFAEIVAFDAAGNFGLSRASGSWTTACPLNYVRVPMNSLYTTKDFCVAKYEMKNVGGLAASQASAQPWTGIPRGATSTEDGSGWKKCRSLGTGYDLISNAQWQTIARNLTLQSANWTSWDGGSGGPASGATMYRGHSDGYEEGGFTATAGLEASIDTDPYYGTGNSAIQTAGAGKEQRRTLTLSNGEVIWDFAGNAWEWVKEDYNGLSAFDDYITYVTTTYPTNSAVIIGSLSGTFKFHFGPAANYTPVNTEYFGFGTGYFDTVNGAIIRGGTYHLHENAGVFATSFSRSTAVDMTGPHSQIGFRCVHSE